jgi:hypothetical protein
VGELVDDGTELRDDGATSLVAEART